MKKILMCEGKHDSLLINQICVKLNIPKPKIFDQRNAKEKPSRDAETVEFRRFFEKSNPYKFLVKSECGKDNAIKLYSRSMNFFINNRELKKSILMLDLDDTPLESRLGKIIKSIKEKKVGEPISIKSNTIKDTGIFYLVENIIEISENRDELGKFHLVFFKRSLEKELEEIKNKEDIPIEDKISQFINITEVQNVFSLVLN